MTRRPAKAPGQRQLRVGEELRHVLAEIIERTDFRDPNLAEVSVTVTEVRVSPDLRSATVFVIPLGGAPVAPVLEGLGRVRSYLRHEIGRMVRLQFVPELSFQGDASFDRAGYIEDILHRPDVRRDLASEAATRSEDDE